MRQKYWRFRLNFEIVKVRLSAMCKQSFLPHMPLTVYKTFAWQTFALLRLFTCLVYVSTYCVPIAHLRQNKPLPLLYLGHAQIIIPLALMPSESIAHSAFGLMGYDSEPIQAPEISVEHTSTSEIPTLSYTWSLNWRYPPSGGASSYRPS